jgi:hypothetical protein
MVTEKNLNNNILNHFLLIMTKINKILNFFYNCNIVVYYMNFNHISII